MSYQALARKWRPQTFRDVIGQEPVVRTLQHAIEQDRIHHAYLFSGVRGVGKTTAARIFAKAVNCVKGPTAEPCNECSICREITEGIDLDVLEVDAATYTGVDNVRELRDITQFQPARDRRRVFIIDEAHMLSTPSWNALLKLIEEPPPHMIFIMATTEMQKVPATILSRVQRFVFSKITQTDVVNRLKEICSAEGIEAEGAALEIIARRGEGSVRDSLSLLDQVIAFSGRSFTASDVTTILGISEVHFFSRIAGAIQAGDHSGVLVALDEAAASGRDFKLLFRDFLGFLRNLLLLRGGAPEAMINATPEELSVIIQTAGQFEYSELLRLLNLLIRDDEIVSKAEQQRLAVEISLLKAATLPRLRSIEAALGDAPAGNVRTPAPAAPVRSAPPKRETPGPQAVGGEALSLSTQTQAPNPAGQPERLSSTSPAAAPTGSVEALLEAIRNAKRSTWGYLQQAKNTRITPDRIIFEYEPVKRFTVEQLSERDQLDVIEKAAAQTFGRPMKAEIVVGEGAVEAEAPPARTAIASDPVLQRFSKHLGGEVVTQKKKRTES